MLSPNGHIEATRLHPRITCSKGRRGMWVSAGLGLRGGRISCVDKEEEGARGYVGGGR